MVVSSNLLFADPTRMQLLQHAIKGSSPGSLVLPCSFSKDISQSYLNSKLQTTEKKRKINCINNKLVSTKRKGIWSCCFLIIIFWECYMSRQRTPLKDISFQDFFLRRMWTENVAKTLFPVKHLFFSQTPNQVSEKRNEVPSKGIR